MIFIKISNKVLSEMFFFFFCFFFTVGLVLIIFATFLDFLGNLAEVM